MSNILVISGQKSFEAKDKKKKFDREDAIPSWTTLLYATFRLLS